MSSVSIIIPALNEANFIAGTLIAAQNSIEQLEDETARDDIEIIVVDNDSEDGTAKLAEETGYGVFAYSRAGYGHSDPADLPRPLDYMTREAVDVPMGAGTRHGGR